MHKLDYKRAYILGLLVGGGKIDKGGFVIEFPFKKWGLEAKRMSTIATDILTRIQKYYLDTYRIPVTYSIGNSKWIIRPIDGSVDISPIIADLSELGLPTGGFLLASADLEKARKELPGNSVESFLSGIFDTRASLTVSHRRFSSDAPVVSIEIPGSTQNFKVVVQICSWLTDLGSITDQILYNHPNQHSAWDPYYKSWKKGFKIRFLVKSFLSKHSFALEAKVFASAAIEKSQLRKEQIPCKLRALREVGPVSIHGDQNSEQLPDEVKNRVFFHYHHFCAVIECPHAPIGEIEKLVSKSYSLISFFPILTKGRKVILRKRYRKMLKEYFPKVVINKRRVKVGELISRLSGAFSGLRLGVAYLFSSKLKGNRHIGPMEAILSRCVDRSIVIYSPDFDSNEPLMVMRPDKDRAFVCSSPLSLHNQELIADRISRSGMKVEVR
jgi:hypothetical protein